MQKTSFFQTTSISYRIVGKGKPVVLLHGFGEDSHIWDRQVNFLQDHCLLILPDLPGTGQSELLIKEDGSPVSIEDYADCIYAVLQEENIPQCTMLGHSMGGYIMLAFAEKYSDCLTRFGLIHSTAFPDNEEKKINRQRSIELMEAHGAFSFLKNTIPTLFGKAFKEANPGQVESLIESARQFTKEACQQYYTAMMNRPDRTKVLKGNRLPVLFVLGTEDVAAPLNDVLQQTHLPDCSYIHILEKTGHMGMWEATAQMNQYLFEFINR